MAKVILHPIGTPLEDAVEERACSENRERMEELNRVVYERREEGGPRLIRGVTRGLGSRTQTRMQSLEASSLELELVYGHCWGTGPGKDPADRVWAESLDSVGAGGQGEAGHLRLSGLHPLLGAVPERQVGHQTENRTHSFQSGAQTS